MACNKIENRFLLEIQCRCSSWKERRFFVYRCEFLVECVARLAYKNSRLGQKKSQVDSMLGKTHLTTFALFETPWQVTKLLKSMKRRMVLWVWCIRTHHSFSRIPLTTFSFILFRSYRISSRVASTLINSTLFFSLKLFSSRANKRKLKKEIEKEIPNEYFCFEYITWYNLRFYLKEF